MWDGHLEQVIVSKQRINVLIDEVRPVPLALFRAEPTSIQFVAAEINGILAENIIEPACTEWAAHIAFVCSMVGLLRFCIA